MTWLLMGLLMAGPTLDQYGKPHDPNNLPSPIVVLDFAALWCKPCIKALPHIEALYKSGNVPVLVLDQDEQEQSRDRLVKKLSLSVPVVWDKDHQWAQTFKPDGMPCTMIVDGRGNVLYKQVGYDDKTWQTFLATLKALQQESQ